MNNIMAMIEFAIKHMFRGNRSAFARALGTDPSELRKKIRRLNNGGNCPWLVDRILEFYMQNPDLWDELMKARAQNQLMPMSGECKHTGIMTVAMVALHDSSECLVHERRMNDLTEITEDFASVMESVCCGKNSDCIPACAGYAAGCSDDRYSRDDDTWPCVAFNRLVDCMNQTISCPCDRVTTD